MPQEPQFVELVRRVRAGDQDAVIALHAIFAGGMRYLIARHLGSDDIEDRLHDSFILVLEAILRGELRDSERLTGFILTIVKRQVAAQLRSRIDKRHEQVELEDGSLPLTIQSENPEQHLTHLERRVHLRHAFDGMSPKDSEVLTRFYLNDESAETICEQMLLTATQFRLLKNRAKDRLASAMRSVH